MKGCKPPGAARIVLVLSAVTAAIALGACRPAGEVDGRGATARDADPYDPAAMQFGAPEAVVSREPRGGPYAEGSALSMGVELAPLDEATEKTIRLDATHKVIELSPGVQFSAWTFGDQVPGPTIRARVGDRIHFSMTNRTDEPVPGVRITSAPMMHSMDFHSAMVAPDDKYRSIAPGSTVSFEFTVNYPGVYMYHCGTPMVLEHIAAGMYGMMIVEPREGYPTKVDREYAIIQSEFYTQLDSQGRKADGQPLYVLDTERMRMKLPTYTVFNGRHNGMVDQPITAEAGERVRLFVLNVGPSNTSSFHVVGTIFDRVWFEGNPENQWRGAQTVLLGSSNSAIVEFYVPEAGEYVMVDHHFANASQGAIGFLRAGGPVGASEHHNIPATVSPTDPGAVRGKHEFESKCLACHSIGGGDRLGPDLLGVTNRRDEDWLRRFMKQPEVMLETDPIAIELLEQYKVPMPNQNLTDRSVQDFLDYFRWADGIVRESRSVE